MRFSILVLLLTVVAVAAAKQCNVATRVFHLGGSLSNNEEVVYNEQVPVDNACKQIYFTRSLFGRVATALAMDELNNILHPVEQPDSPPAVYNQVPCELICSLSTQCVFADGFHPAYIVNALAANAPAPQGLIELVLESGCYITTYLEPYLEHYLEHFPPNGGK
jgi:hypothetical protein